MKRPGWKRPDVAVNLVFGTLTVVLGALTTLYLFGVVRLSIQEFFN